MEKEKKELTGYPHIDKPWMQYYDESLIDDKFPEKTIYQYMKEKSSIVKNKPAITYYGKKIIFDELYDNIETSAKILTDIGIKTQDRVMYLVPNIPEAAYTFYGTSEIGAIADYIDPRPDSVDLKVSSQKVLSLIKKEKVKHIIALDQCYFAMIKPIENELKEMGINQIILLTPQDSMNINNVFNYLYEILDFNGLKFFKEKLKHTSEISKLVKDAIESSELEILYYSDLINNSKYSRFNSIPYQKDLLTAIVHSSGTTSPIPKAIPLTHDNLNGYVHQSFFANMPMQYGDSALHILPYFAAYGLTNNVHSGFCHGTNMIQIPEFIPSNLGKLIKKYKPQTLMGVPSWFIQLMDDKILENMDLSFIRLLTSGGDSITADDEVKFNNFLHNHNCYNDLTKGHGMSETSGCSSFSIGNYNKLGSMGIPLPLVDYGFVDPKTKELLRFEDGMDNLEGEIIISGQTVTPGVLDDVEMVNSVTIDGKKFIYTNDIASIDKNGIITFKSRNDRTFTRYDGFKVRSFEIENVISENENVKYCIIAPYFDKKNVGNMPIAFIVLEDDIEMLDDVEIVKDIINNQFISNKNVSSRQIPSKFKILSELPLTKNGKVDYKSLSYRDFDGTEINVDLEETNLSIKDVRVYRDSTLLRLKKQ